MPKWIHDRAEHLLAKNPSMTKSKAFAIATQQSHALGKSPKGYGTVEGRSIAKKKYDTPKGDKKTANPGKLNSPKLAAQCVTSHQEESYEAGKQYKAASLLSAVNRPLWGVDEYHTLSKETPEHAEALARAQDYRKRIGSRLNVSPYLAGSMATGLNVPGSFDYDYGVGIKSKAKFDKLVKRLSHSPDFQSSEFNVPGTDYHVFKTKLDGQDVDLALLYGSKASQQRKALRDVGSKLSDDEKRHIVGTKAEAPNMWFLKKKRLKNFKRSVDEELGLPRFNRDPIEKTSSSLKELARKDVFGHRTQDLTPILASGKILSAADAAKAGLLQSVEKPGAHRGERTVPNAGSPIELRKEIFMTRGLLPSSGDYGRYGVMFRARDATASPYLNSIPGEHVREKPVQGNLHFVVPDDEFEDFQKKYNDRSFIRESQVPEAKRLGNYIGAGELVSRLMHGPSLTQKREKVELPLPKTAAWKDEIPGGLSDKKTPEDFPAKALAKGKKVELEHTNSPHMATEISMDHLTEDPKYYEKLEKMESKEGMAKRALLERLVRLGATDVPGTPRMLLKHRSPQELAALQQRVGDAFKKLEAPVKEKVRGVLGKLPQGKIRKAMESGADLLVENPEVLPMQAVPVPGLTPAYMAAKKGTEKLIDRFAPIKMAACLDELAKIGGISDEQARQALERYQSLEKSKPTPGQVARYAAIGATAAPLIGAIGDLVSGGGIAKATSGLHLGRQLAAKSLTGALGYGAVPLVRSYADRRAAMGQIKRYLGEHGVGTDGHPDQGQLQPPFEPVQKTGAPNKKEKDSALTGITPARAWAADEPADFGKVGFSTSQYSSNIGYPSAPQASKQAPMRAPNLGAVVQHTPQRIKTGYTLQGQKNFQGLDVAIENRKGSVRKGKDKDGKEWRTEMKHPYGYIRGTKGADGEEVDAYVGPKKDATHAYVVHQHKEDGKGYDEDKVMLGFPSKGEARKAFLQHYDSSKFLGPIKEVPMDRFKKVVKTKKKLEKISMYEPWPGCYAEMDKFAEVEGVHVGQWWESVGGPFLARGGQPGELKKMMHEAGIPPAMQKRFLRAHEVQKKKDEDFAKEKFRQGFGGGGGGAPGGFTPFFSSTASKAINVGGLGLAAGLAAHTAFAKKKEDPATAPSEARGLMGAVLENATPLASAGLGLGLLRSGLNVRKGLAGAGIGAAIGGSLGMLVHHGLKAQDIMSAKRGLRYPGTEKRITDEASMTEAQHRLHDPHRAMITALPTLPMAVAGQLPAGIPAGAVALHSLGQGMRAKYHAANTYKHLQDLKRQGLQKTSAGAPTAGGFLMASDVPPMKAPNLATPIQLSPQKIVEKIGAALTPAGRLVHTQGVGKPKVSAPPGPSVADTVSTGGSRLPGANKTTIGKRKFPSTMTLGGLQVGQYA